MTRLIQNQQQLAQWAREVKGSLDIAVAFWGERAITELGLDQRRGDVRILLDLSAGATNPAVVRQLLQLHPANIRSLPRLHAKAYIGENEMIVGSANASANGLGIEGQAANHWIELGILTDDTVAIQDAKRWFAERWSESDAIDVDSAYFKQIEAAWTARQKFRQAQDTQPDSLIAAALKTLKLSARNAGLSLSTFTICPPKAKRLWRRSRRNKGNRHLAGRAGAISRSMHTSSASITMASSSALQKRTAPMSQSSTRLPGKPSSCSM